MMVFSNEKVTGVFVLFAVSFPFPKKRCDLDLQFTNVCFKEFILL